MTPRAEIWRWRFGPKLTREERDNLFVTDHERAWAHAGCIVNHDYCGRDDCPLARYPDGGELERMP